MVTRSGGSRHHPRCWDTGCLGSDLCTGLWRNHCRWRHQLHVQLFGRNRPDHSVEQWHRRVRPNHHDRGYDQWQRTQFFPVGLQRWRGKHGEYFGQRQQHQQRRDVDLDRRLGRRGHGCHRCGGRPWQYDRLAIHHQRRERQSLWRRGPHVRLGSGHHADSCQCVRKHAHRRAQHHSDRRRWHHLQLARSWRRAQEHGCANHYGRQPDPAPGGQCRQHDVFRQSAVWRFGGYQFRCFPNRFRKIHPHPGRRRWP